MIYEDETGYIKGYLRGDGFWWIEKFVIHPEFRGKGYARKLAAHLPDHSGLLAYPMFQMKGKVLGIEPLVKFYESLGFHRNPRGDHRLMWRGLAEK